MQRQRGLVFTAPDEEEEEEEEGFLCIVAALAASRRVISLHAGDQVMAALCKL